VDAYAVQIDHPTDALGSLIRQAEWLGKGQAPVPTSSTPMSGLAPVKQVQAVAAEPVKAAPVEAEPVKAEPVKADPIEAEPVKIEPVEVEPAEVEPTKVEPVRAVPVEVEPVEAEPVKAEPVEAEPVRAEPVKAMPPCSQSGEPVPADLELLTVLRRSSQVREETSRRA